MRPGYAFPSAEAALSYGHDVCDRVTAGLSYQRLLTGVKSDIATEDDYQGAYLINQAVNKLCPEQIWQLRQSAAGFTGSPESQR